MVGVLFMIRARHVLLLLGLIGVSLTILTPLGIGQTSLTTVTSTSTLTYQPSTITRSYAATTTSLGRSTMRLLVNTTVSLYSTYNSTSEPSTPSMDTNLLLLVAVNVLVAAFLIFTVTRYMKRRRK
jgi:hypothetical protein